MNREARKLHLIEELLKVENEETLSKLEAVLKTSSERKAPFDVKEYAGIFSEEETNEMEKIIDATCEQINPDDWK